MSLLSKSNVKEHCRTCLKRLNDSTENCTTGYPIDEFESKDIHFNICNDPELQQLICINVDGPSTTESFNPVIQDYPENVCLPCYNILCSFAVFRKRAQQSAEKLRFVLNWKGNIKVAIQSEESEDEQHKNEPVVAPARQWKFVENCPKMEKSRKNKFMWSPSNEELFCELWAGRAGEIRGMRKNHHVLKEIADRLAAFDCKVSSQEVRTKMNNLIAKYRKEKEKVSCGATSEWPLYEQVHSIVEGNIFSNVESLTDESMDREASQNSSAPPSPRVEHTFRYKSMTQDIEPTPQYYDASCLKNKKRNTSELANEMQETETTPEYDGASCSKSRKRKTTELAMEMQQTRGVLEKMRAEERETDSRLLSIEERRNELLERLLQSINSK